MKIFREKIILLSIAILFAIPFTLYQSSRVMAKDDATAIPEKKLKEKKVESIVGSVRSFWKKEKLFYQDKKLDYPPFHVPSRIEQLDMYPCMDCHEETEANADKERVLQDEHENIKLNHGGGRFWCTTCHSFSNRNYLRSFKNKKISFNESYLLCGQCHFKRQKDWFFGGHGKRVDNWNGEKIILLCTECHNPHSPHLKPVAPNPPPEKHMGPYHQKSDVADQSEQKHEESTEHHQKKMVWEKIESNYLRSKRNQ